MILSLLATMKKISYTKVSKYIIKWYSIRYRRGYGKNTAVELADMADSNSVDSKEEQEANTSVDNVCYTKIKIPCKSGSEKDTVVEEAVMMDEGSVDRKEQDVGTSVDNVCYDRLESK